MIIDVEHHYYLTDPSTEVSKLPGQFQRIWDADGQIKLALSDAGSRVERHLEFMDQAGIDMAVLTGNVHGCPLEAIKKWNDACAAIVRAYPKRFVGFAIAQPLGGSEGADELKRAVLDLGMKGVQIRTQVERKTLDCPELFTFYEQVCELGIPIDVHVTTAPLGYDGLNAPFALYYNVAREFDMIATVFRLCFGGVLERFPDLVFIMNHFGGGVSSIKDRMDHYVDLCGESFWQSPDRPLIHRPWTRYFEKLYFNMAGRGVGMATVRCALSNISPDKLLFGTDWPANFENDPSSVRQYIQEIRKLNLSQQEIDGMLGDNAVRLLGQ